MPQEEIDLVDEENNVVGRSTLEKCLTEGLLHRAIICFVRDSLGRVYLQQRSYLDDWLPGMWTASCTGHVQSGESPDDAAKRELKEELGIEGHPSFLFRFLVPEISHRGNKERELSFVFELVCDTPIRPSNVEIEKMKLFSLIECERYLMGHPDETTLDARMAFERYFRERNH
jgi:isopentenyl-diphosphate Delta-isomerase